MGSRERRWKGPSFAPGASARKRVVVEGGDGAERWILARALHEAGFDVVRCGGPAENGGPCPLVAGRGCDAVERADGVVNLLGLRSPDGEEILRAVRAAAPHAGIVAQVTPFDRERLAPLLADCECYVVSPRATADALTSTVVRATSPARSAAPGRAVGDTELD